MSRTLHIGFETDPEYRLHPVHGVWGGVSPTGDVIADLYVERLLPPEEITLEVETNVAREVDRKGERRVRRLLAGLSLRPDIAYAVGMWLISKAKAAGFVPPENETH